MSIDVGEPCGEHPDADKIHAPPGTRLHQHDARKRHNRSPAEESPRTIPQEEARADEHQRQLDAKPHGIYDANGSSAPKKATSDYARYGQVEDNVCNNGDCKCDSGTTGHRVPQDTAKGEENSVMRRANRMSF